MKRKVTMTLILGAFSTLLLAIPSLGQSLPGEKSQMNPQESGCCCQEMMGSMGMGQMQGRGMRMQGMQSRGMMGNRGGMGMQGRMGGMGRGMMGGGIMQGMQGRQGQRMGGMGNDMMTAHQLVMQHEQVNRSVKQLPSGVETLTESDDSAVAAKIQEHVPAMYERLKENQPIHQMDPLFRELFRYGSQIKSEVTLTPHGVRVVETSEDPYVVKLIKAHAQTVDALVKRGMEAMHEQHEVPKR